MEEKANSILLEIRDFNRFYTNTLGLVNKHILDSPYSLTEARILFEIGNTSNCTASMLAEKLNIDRGYMSRILKKFEAKNLIYRENSCKDGRTYYLHLTPEGNNTFSYLNHQSNTQIQNIISHLSTNEKQKLLESVRCIKNLLTPSTNPFRIRSFLPQDLGTIVEKHYELYKTEFGFDLTFKDYVGNAVDQFAKSHDKNKENIWVVEMGERVVGSIAIVKVDDKTAQLRWFLIDPDLRGKGLGNKLMATAVDFCRLKGYTCIFLWTVSILQAARHLYQQYGFSLTATEEHDVWGKHLIEERWDLRLP